MSSLKNISPKTLKGFRDFLPKEAVLRQKIINIIQTTFEKFGFDPIETPALEYAETLLGKYGSEADKLIYLFNDRGGRQIGLKYDQTVPLARIIAQYQNIPKPFKRYQIGTVWRAENPQHGRYREFVHCDIDIVGEKNILADGEIIVCALETTKKLGFKNAVMLINDRTLFAKIKMEFITSIDKLAKIGHNGVINELIRKGLTKTQAQKLLISIKNHQPTERLRLLFKYLKSYGLKEGVNFKFDPFLARGLDYYTESIFELVSPDYLSGSLGGGGRYDNLISLFTGKDEPAVGFAFGFDRLVEAIKNLNLINLPTTKTQILITVFNEITLNQSLSLAQEIRNKGINCEIYPNIEKKLDKQLKYADKKGIPFVVILGPEEIKKGAAKIKNMRTKEQKELLIKDIIKEFSNYHL